MIVPLTSLKGLSKGVPPDRLAIASFEAMGVDIHPNTQALATDDEALAKAFGGAGVRDIFSNGIVTACAFGACIGGLLFGFDQGLLSIVLVMPRFQQDFPEVENGWNTGLMTALLQLGALIGAAMSGFLADRYSRKASIAIGTAWGIVGSVIQTVAANFATLSAGRFIAGVGTGILSSTAPMYIAEISPPNIRGALLVMEAFAVVLGIVVMFFITYGTRYLDSSWCWRLPFLLPVVPSIPLLFGVLWAPYSPRWLAGKGRDLDALRSLCRLRRLPSSDPRVQAEWITIRADAVHSRESLLERHDVSSGISGLAFDIKLEALGWRDMFGSKTVRRTIIGMGLMFFQQFIGINALIYYSPTLFEQLGLEYELRLILSGIMNIIQLVAVTFALLYLDRIGRKLPLYVGSLGTAACHFIVGALIARFSYDWSSNVAPAWVGVSFIFLFMAFFGVSWNPVPWSMPAELFSSSNRAKGVALATCSNWFNNFVIGLISPPMLENTGFGVFIFFGSFSVLSIFFNWFLVPETKGKSLEQMDQVFHTDTAKRDVASKQALIELMVCGDSSFQQPSGSTTPAGTSNPKNKVEEQTVEDTGEPVGVLV